MERVEAVRFLLDNPASFGRMVGFDKLTPLNNEWIREMISGQGDKTLQAHRGSYKTTCVSIALAELMILLPKCRTLFVRKTDDDVKEVIAQVRKILEDPHTQYFVQSIYGCDLKFTKADATSLSTNLSNDTKGTAQLTAFGTGASVTGKHFDRIFTDDIVNVKDRISRAEREHTKVIFQELQNVRNRGGRIFNTGTPWHKDDCFTLMPNVERWDCYTTGLITPEELDTLRKQMTASLFSANYELRHIASDDVIFTTPKFTAETKWIEQGISHIDAAYGGEDYTAFTIGRKVGDTYYLLGKLWHRHIDDVLDPIIALRTKYNTGNVYAEDNGDKGYLVKDLRRRGERAVAYHENTNKFLKITSFLKGAWENVVFVEGTDPEYINQICDYTENAEHDDAPDSAASIIRLLWKK